MFQKTFNIYRKDDVIELVKSGFSFPALFFGFLWVISKRIHILFFPALANLIAIIIVATVNLYIALILLFTLHNTLFSFGNSCLMRKLESNGFTIVGQVKATSKKSAYSTIISNHIKQ